MSFCLGSQSCQYLDTEKSCDSNDPQEGRGGSVSLLNGKSPPEVKYILHAPPLNYSWRKLLNERQNVLAKPVASPDSSLRIFQLPFLTFVDLCSLVSPPSPVLTVTVQAPAPKPKMEAIKQRISWMSPLGWQRWPRTEHKDIERGVGCVKSAICCLNIVRD